jgi:hypothetical protein
MAFHVRHIVSHLQRWRTGSVAACFSWPSLQTDTFLNTVANVGETVWLSEKVPNWRYRIAHGINATGNWDAERRNFTYTPGSVFLGKWCNSTQRFGYYQYDGDLFQGSSTTWTSPSSPPTVIDPQVRDEALGRAIQDARSKQSHFRGGNFLAELNDTIRGFRNPAKGFRDLLDVYHRNARKRVKRAIGRRSIPVTQQDFRRLERDAPDVGRAATRALSDSWLEHNYGWAPLLSDAVSAYQALRRLSAKTGLARFYGTSSRDGPPTYVSDSRNLEACTIDWQVKTFLRYDVTFYGAVKVEVSSPVSSRLEEFGVTASNFLPAVWEAIPYSFIVDYFTNVGEIIESVSFPRSDLSWITRTYRNHSIRSTDRVAITGSSLSYPTSNSDVVWQFTAPRVEWDLTRVFRSNYVGFAVPGLRFEIPGAKNWRKWLNMAALAHLRTL